MYIRYDIIQATETCIVLKDLGPWDRYMTITNAAEHVIEDMQRIFIIGNRRIFYYDSEDELTELLVKDGRFAGLAPAKKSDIGVNNINKSARARNQQGQNRCQVPFALSPVVDW